MAKRKKEEFTFAAAYIGSFVKNLMSRQDMMRLASCKDLASAEAVLQEFGYGEARELHDGDIGGFIRREQEALYHLVYDTIPVREVMAYCLYPYDYHNVKVCLKSEFLGIAPSGDYMITTGDIDWKKIVSMVRERSYDAMPVHMKHAVIEAADLFGRGGDPQEIDIIVDKACYRDMAEAAQATEEEFLIGIVRLQIDIINLKTFVRLRQMNKPWSFFKKVFVEGGNIGEQFFISSYEEPYAQVADKLIPYGLRTPLADGAAALKDQGSFNLFEKLCDNCLMEYVKKAKYESFGIAPVAGYWYAKDAEINNLRMILTGILIGDTPEKIGERLREPYV